MRTFILILSVYLSLSHFAEARAVRPWSYAELLESSDVVVMIEPQKVITNATVLAVDSMDSATFEGLTTTCSVLALMKGDIKQSATIDIFHFRYRDGMTPPNGASFVVLPVDNIDFVFRRLFGREGSVSSSGKMRTQFIAFLKFDKEGHLIPTTGQYDADDSFRLIMSAGPVIGDQLRLLSSTKRKVWPFDAAIGYK